MITISHYIVRAMAENGVKGIGKRRKDQAVLERQHELMRLRLAEIKTKKVSP